MLHVAVDDTDARDGGCTTFLAARLREAFPELELSGLPRLVRLNPQVPWKTRGNAAVALSFSGSFDLEEAARRVEAVVRRHARVDRAGTEPGFAVADRPLPEVHYWRAVREMVPVEEAARALDAAGARYGGLGLRRGLVGCAAALAWPERARTWELIAYRHPERVGTPREVDAESVRAMQAAFPSTFGSFDEVHGKVVMVPSTPCPVLYGVRGTVAGDLPRAAERVQSEPVHERTLFVTNQATDDHLQDARLGEVRAFTSVRVAGRVLDRPRLVGGHAFVRLADGGAATLRVAAYAPTRDLVARLLALRPGDEVLACGGVKRGPDGELTLGLEKLRVLELARDLVKVANPRCPQCGRRAKSAGRHAGYRCPDCGARCGEPERAEAPRRLAPGWYEAPAIARRHLARPLSLSTPEALSEVAPYLPPGSAR